MSGWTTKKLGEVCEVQLGKMLDKAKNKGKPYKYLANLSVRWRSFDLSNLRTMPFMDSEVEKFSLRPGDILMCEGGEPGRCAIWQIPDSDIKFQKAVHRIRSKGTIEPAYLVAYFESIVNTVEFNSRLTGATIKHLPRERLLEIPIPIPPLAEQKRIVAKIDAAFEKIDKLKANAEKNLANAKELFQSALDEAMCPKKGWVEKRLGEVANIRVGPFGSSLHKADYVDNGVPLVNPCHMKDSKIADRISTQVSHDKAESLKEYRLKAGDIVFARRGEIGRLAFVSEKEDGYLCGTGSLFARFRERYDIQFLYFFFSSKSFVERLELLSTGTTMKSINSSALESMSFSVPLMNDQQRLAKQLDSLSQKTKALQQNYARQIADCAEMRQAILREAFEGKMRTRRDALRNLAGSWIDSRATDEIANDIERHRTAGRRLKL